MLDELNREMQLPLGNLDEYPAGIAALREMRSGTFVDNMKLPIHRWYRFSAGFSADWVKTVARDCDGILFDPFAGSGTTLVAGMEAGLTVSGVEAHPFVARVLEAKTDWDVSPAELVERSHELLARAWRFDSPAADVPDLLRRCYDPESLIRLIRLRCAWEAEPADKIGEKLWLAITSILRECSGAGTAQWQYVLPNKSKTNIREPYSAFTNRARMMAADLHAAQQLPRRGSVALFHPGDARETDRLDAIAGQVSQVITSPPYPNNYDYADATRLEMTFWQEIGRWAELHAKVRHKLVCSCSQHASAEKFVLDELLSDPLLEPIADEITAVCRELDAIRHTKGGRKAYHTMIAAYFSDLARVWKSLRTLCRKDAKVCFVIGDSAPYGVYVPVDRWLTRLGEAQGFRFQDFEKVRERNIKWKNRKHNVPLKEGRLWMRG